MFLEDVFLEDAKAGLFDLVAVHKLQDVDPRFPWDRYIAMSLMQKAIRRGDVKTALFAGMFLFTTNEQGFWKRLCVCAIEDIGIANLTLVAQVLIADKGKQVREALGGSKRLAQVLLYALCQSPKDRSADDLIDAINWVSGFSEYKADIADLSETELSDIIASKQEPVQHRAIAAVERAIGWKEATSGLGKGHRWYKVLNDIPEDMASPCALTVSRMGLKRTRVLMAPLLTLIYAHKTKHTKYADDTLPKTVDIQGLPSWVLDGHVRAGLESFKLYIKRSRRMSAFLACHATRNVSLPKTVAGLVFRFESGQLIKRLDWTIGRQLKRQACANRPGLPDAAVAEGMSILQSEFDLLNECRITAMQNTLR